MEKKLYAITFCSNKEDGLLFIKEAKDEKDAITQCLKETTDLVHHHENGKDYAAYSDFVRDECIMLEDEKWIFMIYVGQVHPNGFIPNAVCW